MKKLFVAFLTLLSGFTQAQAIDFNCTFPSDVTVNWILNGTTVSETITVAYGDNKIPIYYNLPSGFAADKKFDVVSTQPNVHYAKVNVSAEADATQIVGSLIIDSQSPGGYLGEINIDLTDDVYNEKFDFSLSTSHYSTNVEIDVDTNTFYNSLVGIDNSEIFHFEIPEGYTLTEPHSIGSWAGTADYKYRFLSVALGAADFRVEFYVTGNNFGDISSLDLPIDDALLSIVPEAQTAVITLNWYIDNVSVGTTTETVLSDDDKITYGVSFPLPSGYEVDYNHGNISAGNDLINVFFELAGEETILQGTIKTLGNFDYTNQTFDIYLVTGTDVKNTN